MQRHARHVYGRCVDTSFNASHQNGVLVIRICTCFPASLHGLVDASNISCSPPHSRPTHPRLPHHTIMFLNSQCPPLFLFGFRGSSLYSSAVQWSVKCLLDQRGRQRCMRSRTSHHSVLCLPDSVVNDAAGYEEGVHWPHCEDYVSQMQSQLPTPWPLMLNDCAMDVVSALGAGGNR